jgi:DNA-binding GntR family transcriptional regulator
MPSEPAQDLCTNFLRSEIMAGRLVPGERIRPEAVAAHLGLSRMPVREALRQLDAEGLITLRPNRGAVVTQLDRDSVAEIYEMRAVLEGLCARHAAARANLADVEELDALVQAMRRVTTDPLRWVERHEEFHARLCTLGGRLRAAGEARRLRLLLRPSLSAFAAQNRDPEALGHEHDVIVDALRDRDGARAEQLAIAHVMANAAELLGPRPKAAPRRAVARQG